MAVFNKERDGFKTRYLSALHSNPFEVLEGAGAVYRDKHFVYKSGKHGSGYVDMDNIYPNMELMSAIATLLDRAYGDYYYGVIVAPAEGGIALASDVASRRASYAFVKRIWASKQGDDFVFDRAGFAEHVEKENVLVVEDLVTTGGSVAKVCALVEQHGGRVVGVSAVCNRGGVTAEQLDWPIKSICEVNFDAVNPEDCELCREQVPIVADVGHPWAFLNAHPDYPHRRLLSG